MNNKQLEATKKILNICSENQSLTLLDIGAAGGIQSRWSMINEYLRVIGVEPDLDSHAKLMKNAGPNEFFLNVGLTDKSAKHVLNLAKERVCSSLYKPNMSLLNKFHNPQRFEIVDTVEIACSTLDEEFKKNDLGYTDFVKLDVQGSELGILSGGQKVISRAFGIEVEVEFQPLYEEQPLFGDVDQFMREHGFELFDISRHFWRRTAGGKKGSYRGQLIWGDALYLRSVSSFIDILSQIDSHKEKILALRNAITISLLYGYPDYAKEIIRDTKTLLFYREYLSIENQIDKYICAIYDAPEMRGKARLVQVLDRIYGALRFSRFNSDDQKLGN